MSGEWGLWACSVLLPICLARPVSHMQRPSGHMRQNGFGEKGGPLKPNPAPGLHALETLFISIPALSVRFRCMPPPAVVSLNSGRFPLSHMLPPL